MDFVVVGFGVGALGVLLGVLLRGWLAARCERAALRAADPAVAAYERANAADCLGAGQAFLAAGGAVMLATVGGLAGGLDDRSGAVLVVTTATVAALGIILWGYLYRSRHPLPTRPRRRSLPIETAAAQVLVPDLGNPQPANLLDAVAPPAADHVDGGEAVAVLEAEEPNPAESLVLSENREEAAAPEDSDAATDDTAQPGAGAMANGHPTDEVAAAEHSKIVAFVGRQARTDARDDAGHDDEDELDER